MNIQAYKDKYKEDKFFREVFTNNEYNLGYTVLDIGACAGEFSFWIYGMADKIYALEPEKTQYQELVENINTYGFERVKPFKLALGNYNGEIDLSGKGRGAYKTNDTTPNTHIIEKVPVNTLAMFMNNNSINHVDVMKIDIEDGEEAVFSSPDFIDVAPKIDLIIGEHLGKSGQYLLKAGFKEVVDNPKPNTVFRRVR